MDNKSPSVPIFPGWLGMFTSSRVKEERQSECLPANKAKRMQAGRPMETFCFLGPYLSLRLRSILSTSDHRASLPWRVPMDSLARNGRRTVNSFLLRPEFLEN